MSDFDPFDPVNMAMRSLHKQNLLAAKDAEIANLKAEVERLTGVIKEVVKEAQENSDRFVRRLNEEAAHPACVAMNRKLGDANNEIHHLKAEVERLRKAGDAMSDVIQTIDHERFECYPKYRMITKERNACDAWQSAKEGKPSA